MPQDAIEYAYINPTRRRTLLETPSGFALFDVEEDALKEVDDAWVYFRDVATALNVMFALGFVKFDDKSIAWDGQTRPSKELIRLIQKYCKGSKHLLVQSAYLQSHIEKKLDVKCSYDQNVVDELIWGIKNVLHGFIPQEKDNITREYRLPVSKGLKHCLQDHLINVSPTMLSADFISQIGLLHYLNITLKQVPRILRESYDDHVCGIGKHIENNWMYARVLARILVPELAPEYDFCKMFSPDLALKIQEANESATKYRDEQLTMPDRENIMGALSTLLSVPKQRDGIMIRVKLMEAELLSKEVVHKDGYYERLMRKPTNLERSTFRRTLLETPSGFAIFDINEDVFRRPGLVWARFSDEMEAREVVLALGFVNVHDKSIARNSYNGPGQELSSLIQKFCAHNTKLIVQDDALKSVIEEKLNVKCCSKFSNDDDSLGDLMWGLKNVLHEFIPQEKNNLTPEYYLPMSKGLQNALKSYGVSVSPEQIDRKFVYFLAYLAHLDWISSHLPIIFRKTFDHHIFEIGELIKDDVVYAKVIGQILVPESILQFDYSELLPSDLAEKAAKIEKRVDSYTWEQSIHSQDKLLIVAVRDYLSFIHDNRECYLRFLKYGGSEEELPRVKEAWVEKVNYWLMLVTKAMSDKLIVDSLDSVPDQMRDEYQGNAKVSKTVEKAEKTALEVVTRALEVEKTASKVEMTAPEVGKTDPEFGLSCHDSLEKVPNVEGEPQQQLVYISETADHLAVSKGIENVNQHHFPNTEGDIQAISSVIEPAVGAKVVPVYAAAITTANACSSVDDSIEKDVPSCTVMPSKIDLLDLSVSAKANEFNIVGGTNDVNEKMQSEKSGTCRTSTETNEMHVLENFDGIENTAPEVENTDPEDDLSCHDSPQKVPNVEGGCHLETPNDVKPRQHHISERGGDAQAISSAIGPAVGAKVVPVSVAANTTENASSSVYGTMQKNVTSCTVMPSQIDLLDLSISARAKEFNIVGSTNDIDKRMQSKRSITDQTYTEKNEMHILENFDDVDEQKNREPVVDPTPSMGTGCSISDFEDKKHTEATIEDPPSSGENGTLEGIYDTEIEEQKAGITTRPASNETEVAKNTNVLVEGMTKDIASKEIYTLESTKDARGADHHEGTTVLSPDDLDDRAYEQIMTNTTSHKLSLVTSTSSIQERKDEETSVEATLHKTNDLGDGAYEQTMTNTTSHKLSLVTSTSSIQEMKDEETRVDATSHKTNAAHTTDNIFEQKNGEHVVDQTPSISTKCSISDFEDKKQSEATTEDPSSGKNDTLRGTDDTAATTGPASDESRVAHNTNAVVKGRVKDTNASDESRVATSEEISTVKSTEDAKGADQSEAITDEPSSGENNMLPGTADAENKEQNTDAIKGPASDENKGAQNSYVLGGKTEGTTTDAKGGEQNEEKIIASGRIRSTLRELFNSENMESRMNRDDENTEKTEEILNSENTGSTVNRHDENTDRTDEIFNSEDKESTVERVDENTDTRKEKKARIKNWLRLFRSKSSNDNVLVSSKDNASRSSKDTMSPVKVGSHSGIMWPFRSKRRRRNG